MASQEGLSRYCMKGWGEDRSAKVDRVWGWTCPVSSEMHSKGLAVWCWSWDHGGAGGLGRAGRREVEEEESRVRGGQPDQAAVVPVLSCRCCRTVVAALAASEPCSRSASWSSSLDLEGLHSRAPSVLRIQGNKGSRLRRPRARMRWWQRLPLPRVPPCRLGVVRGVSSGACSEEASRRSGWRYLG